MRLSLEVGEELLMQQRGLTIECKIHDVCSDILSASVRFMTT